VNLVPLKSVEFLSDKRGPGPRNQSDSTATYVTHKAKVGQVQGERELVATGLVLLWDRAASAVYLIKPAATEDPCVCYPWSEVRRVIPESFEWIQREAEREQKGK
jgi:hypothetical protein